MLKREKKKSWSKGYGLSFMSNPLRSYLIEKQLIKRLTSTQPRPSYPDDHWDKQLTLQGPSVQFQEWNRI